MKAPHAILVVFFAVAGAGSCGLGGLPVAPLPVAPDPRRALPEPPEVTIEIQDMGLDGHSVSGDGPLAIRFVLGNTGSGRDVVLRVEQMIHKPTEQTFVASQPAPAPLRVHLAAGESRAVRWAVPPLEAWSTWLEEEQGGAYLVARDPHGAILGAARLPRARGYANPVVVLAEDRETALAVQGAVSRLSPNPAYRHEAALLVGFAPDLWWEYDCAVAVVLARPLRGLSRAEIEALTRYVAKGGILVAVRDLAPDWAEGPWGLGNEATGSTIPYGAGYVKVVPTAGPEGQGSWLGLALPANALPGTLPDQSLPMSMGWRVPSTGTLVVAVLVVALILGPVIHLSLARRGRRKWAWIAVPVASVALSGGMYGLASAIKGEKSGLEVQRLVVSFSGAREATVLTRIRLQTARAGTWAVDVEGNQPRPAMRVLDLFGSGSRRLPTIAIEDDRIRVDRLDLRRWSSRDLGVVTAAEAPPLEIRRTAGGLGVRNTGDEALLEVKLLAAGGWAVLAPRLDPGESLDLPDIPNLAPVGDLSKGPERDALEISEARMLAAAIAIARFESLDADALAILAGCAPATTPRVETRPAVESKRETTRCLWVYRPDADGGAP